MPKPKFIEKCLIITLTKYIIDKIIILSLFDLHKELIKKITLQNYYYKTIRHQTKFVC